MKGPEFPSVLLGCSPFIGAGQFGVKALLYYRKFHLQPENMVRLFLKSFELGVKAVQLLADKPIDALIEASRRARVKPFIIYSTHLSGMSLRNRIEKLQELEPEVIAIHAEIADRLDVDAVTERLDIVKGYGSTLGLATHRPGTTIPWTERKKVPVELVLTPLNQLGYAMEPDFKSSMEAIKACSRKIVAIKPLAAGRLKPDKAFRFVYKYTDSVAVGISSKEEMEQTYKAALEVYGETRKHL